MNDVMALRSAHLLMQLANEHFGNRRRVRGCIEYQGKCVSLRVDEFLDRLALDQADRLLSSLLDGNADCEFPVDLGESLERARIDSGQP